MGGASLMAAAVPSPCIDVCRLDTQGLCVGCRRTLNEIAEWSTAGEARQREILRDVARRKELVGQVPGR
ncbi:MAG TPA: DUF1289 domain-containing protein [Steroidobacteraceae bacterium]|jgi:predicted Fe-S protein YdhL (DUF1289 family)